jgi:tartrate dehydrogenase/decarboxylase/D-malate dehydrogenase
MQQLQKGMTIQHIEGLRMASLKIAVIPGDGIGGEVIPEGIRALEAAGSRHGIAFDWIEFDWSCRTYHSTGRMMPKDGLDRLRPFDAIYLGAVGFPGVPDNVSLWGLLIPIRRGFDQYVNLRPVRLFEGVPCPLAGRVPGDIDFYVVRENVEGEYSALGGIQYEGTEHEMVSQLSLFTRRAPIVFSGMPLNWLAADPPGTSPRPQNPTAFSTPCPIGTAG